MKPNPILLLTILFLSISFHVFGNESEYKISGIEARLFHEQTGSFSKDILSDPNFPFWNTIIGEEPSSSTLVIVQIEGLSGKYLPNREIQLTAEEGGKVKRNERVKIGIIGPSGKYFAGFWLSDTGCSPIRLKAKIIGQSNAYEKEQIIPFECGE